MALMSPFFLDSKIKVLFPLFPGHQLLWLMFPVTCLLFASNESVLLVVQPPSLCVWTRIVCNTRQSDACSQQDSGSTVDRKMRKRVCVSAVDCRCCCSCVSSHCDPAIVWLFVRTMMLSLSPH